MPWSRCRPFVFTALWLACCIPISAAPAPRPYDVDHYDVKIEPDFSSRKLIGEVTIDLHSIADGLDVIELDAAPAIQISAVVENYASLRFERNGSLVIVHPDKPVRLGEERHITIRYEAQPGRGLQFFPNQAWAAYFTSDWMVCNDRPEDRASLHLIITTAPGMKAAASGKLVGTHRAGPRVVSEWRQDQEVPPFVFGFAAGDLVERTAQEDKVKLVYLGPPRLAKDLAKVLHPTEAALRFFVTQTGIPYPGPAYTQALVQQGPEQEEAGLTLLPESYGQDLVSRPDDLWLLAHELAHQWYGIGIACRDWSDFWLSEGMATFLADVFLGEQFGPERYTREIQEAKKTYEQLKAEGKDRPLSVHDWNAPKEAGGSLPYYKGAYVLHLLRQQMGDEAFWRGMRVYTKDNWGKQVTSRDFEKSMEAVTDMPLKDFFDQWIYR